ncbi:hypothetical protein HDV64DRAFT_242925 [Trichoderma sp. TUCIM 5745]
MLSGDRCLLRHGRTSPTARQTRTSHLLSPFCSFVFCRVYPEKHKQLAQSKSRTVPRA